MTDHLTAVTAALAPRIAEDAAVFLDALEAPQRAKASFAFDDEAERMSWAYFPREHKGLPLHEMNIRQQKLLQALISHALSLPGYAKATAIMALESVLNSIEERRGDAVRDPGRYFISVFGSVGAARWGWRLEGHHVCLNFTLVDGEIVSPTPIFFGANPAEVRHGRFTTTRPCAEEEDAARELLDSLAPEQRAQAVICDNAPPDFVLMNLPAVPDQALPGEAGASPLMQRRFDALSAEDKHALRFDVARPLGLRSSGMTSSQQALFGELVDVYVARLPEPLATVERERIQRPGEAHFAWAGSTTRRQAHYYRLQAPDFLVEYDNTQDGANHVHAVWRNPSRDFGVDVLRSHVAADH